MAKYSRFIKENCAPDGAANIGVYQNGSFTGKTIPLGGLSRPSLGNKLYSFGALSDIHNVLYYDYGYPILDFYNALDYLNNKDANFAICCGDLTINGNSKELGYCQNLATERGWTFKQSDGSKKHIYACLGNHEMLGTYWNHDHLFPDPDKPDDEYYDASIGSVWVNWIGRTDVSGSNVTDKHQVVTYGNDVFILFSLNRYVNEGTRQAPIYNNVYTLEDMKWLYNQLMTNRNKRCFVVTHMFMPDKCGNYGNSYKSPMDNQSKNWFDLLFKKFSNVIWFSGHSHWAWECQGNTYASSRANNYDANIYPANTTNRQYGWAVHIPSCCMPRIPSLDDGKNSYEEIDLGSEFALVDVYENGIVINGISQTATVLDDVNADNLKQNPIATYYLDTTLKTVDNTPISAFDGSGSGGSGSTDTGGDTGGESTTARSYIDTTNMIIYGYVGETLDLDWTPDDFRAQNYEIFGASSNTLSYSNRISMSGSKMTFVGTADKNWSDSGYSDNKVNGLSPSSTESDCWFYTYKSESSNIKYKTIIKE